MKLRTEIAAQLVQVGFDPAAVLEAVGLPAMAHTGLPSSQLQQISTIDPNDPEEVYDVRERRDAQMVVQVPEPTVNVAAPTVNVEQPVVMVEAPQVEVASPTVNVEAPKVEVTNTIERKLVRKVVKRDELGRIVEVIEEFMEGE